MVWYCSVLLCLITNSLYALIGCPTGFLDSCKASSAVLRISFALTLIYFLQACGTFVYTKFYDILWVPKSFTFVALVIGFYFAETSVFDTNGYAWFARIIAFGYVILQQIILLDVAYCWNERWLEYAGEDHSQPIWLVGLLVISTVLIAGSIAAIGLMFWQFAGCPETDVILSLTVVLCFIAAMLQLFFTEHGSILTTAIMCSYAAYVAYSAVSINPEEKCNPTLNSGYQTLSIVSNNYP